MSNFWEIKTEDYYWTAIELQKRIPELKQCHTDDIVSNLRGSGLFIVKKQSVKRPVWIRFTLPFAIVFFIALLLFLPIKFIVTGSWSYNNEMIANWFRSVGF